jgi:adenylylsulfate kinase-like enzyme
MTTPTVVLVVGVPGAGKTTVARAVAERLPRSACIEGDLVQHHFTVSGLVPPGGSPPEEADRQLALRWTNCALLARTFVAYGFTALVEHAVSRRSWIDGFLAETAPAPLSLIVLAPALEVTLQRDRDRGTKQVGHLFQHMDAELRTELGGVGWWLDTSRLTVAETVDAVLRDGIEGGRLR